MDGFASIFTSRETFNSDLKDPRFKVLIVDFDNTLLLGNSTELFIDETRPRWAAWLLALAGQRAARLIFRHTRHFDRWCDFFRVEFVACGLPWSLWRWRRNAPKILARRLNHQIYDPLKQRTDATIVIASLGFRQLIHPLLPPLPNGSMLVASDLRSPLNNLRLQGKVAALESRAIRLTTALAVSDSLEDAELLARTGRGYRLEWDIQGLHPKAYFPLRFTAEGKFTPDIFLRQHLQQDLPVIVLAYFDGFKHLPLLLVLFFAFFTVYEIGYYENDFSSARREQQPTLHPGSTRFREYNIYFSAWIWTLALVGAIGLMGSVHLAQLWLAFLVGVRLLFHLYNQLPAKSRIPFYGLLQGCKYFGCWLIFHPCFVGIYLLAAQAVRMIVPYVTYRLTGKPTVTAYQKIRGAAFFGLLAVSCLVFRDKTVGQLLTCQSLCIAWWVCWKVLVETDGYKRWRQALGQTVKRLIGLSPRS